MSDTPRVGPGAPAEPLAAGTRRPLSAVDVVCFFCELFAFLTLAIWGFVAWPFAWNILFGLGAPILAILIWALFVSPRAVLVVHPFVRAVVELLVYVSATIAWWSIGLTWVGLGFAVVAVTSGAIAGRRRFS